VFLADPQCSVSDTRYHDANAIVIRDWAIEVDYRRVQKFDYLKAKHGSLVATNGKVAITCQPSQGRGYTILPVRDAEVPKAPARYACPVWRIYKMRGEEKIVLFERDLPKAS
jgi:hypothetical protein